MSTCQQCHQWVQGAANTPSPVAAMDTSYAVPQNAFLLRDLLMSVQRVMIRHREVDAKRDGNKGMYVQYDVRIHTYIYIYKCRMLGIVGQA